MMSEMDGIIITNVYETTTIGNCCCYCLASIGHSSNKVKRSAQPLGRFENITLLSRRT